MSSLDSYAEVKPKITNLFYKILEGEAVEACRRIPSKSIDLILTDPPFNHETEHYDTREEKFLNRNLKSFADFAIMRHYFADLSKEIDRVLKPSGRILLFCDCKSYPIFWSAFYGYFDHLRALVWYKGDHHFSLGCNQAFRYSYEMILHGFNTDSWFDKSHRQDVIKMKNVPSSKRIHPAQKPTELLSFLIKATCPPGGVVLDLFCGSGSTLESAKQCNCSGIGVDANNYFVNEAKKHCLIGDTTDELAVLLEGMRVRAGGELHGSGEGRGLFNV